MTVERHFMHLWRVAVGEHGPDATARAVAHALGTWMNGEGRCFPSQAEIERRSGYSDTTIRKASERLIAAGLLRVAWSKGRSSHSYVATLPIPEAGSGLTANELRGCGWLTPNLTRLNPEPDAPNAEASSDEGVEEDEGVKGLPIDEVRKLVEEALS